MYFSFLFRMIISKGPHFALIPPAKHSSVFQHFFMRVFPPISVYFPSSYHPPPCKAFNEQCFLPSDPFGSSKGHQQGRSGSHFLQQQGPLQKALFPIVVPAILCTTSALSKEVIIMTYRAHQRFRNSWRNETQKAASLRWTKQDRQIGLLTPCENCQCSFGRV